jgi:serine/threonine-protein kinase
MGEVYLARDTRLDRRVAVKVLSPRVAGDAQLRERFEREAHLVSRLAHPNLCTLFDIGQHDGTDFLVMEYLEGETLAAKLASGPLPIGQGLDYAVQIADGLAKAHAAGVLHRDLKPANVMITTDGIAKLLDFGLAKRFSADEGEATALVSMTGQGFVIGTIAYMAPEQTQGQQADVRSDVFSFGAMLYEMFTGQRPFDGGNLISTIRRINDEEPRPMRAFRPDMPPELEAIVTTALKKHPDQRFQSAGELRLRVRDAAGRTLSVSSATIPRPKPAGRWKPVALAATAVAAVVSAIALFAYSRPPGKTAPRPEPPSAAVPGSVPATAIDWVRFGQTELRRYDRAENIDRAVDAFSKAAALDRGSAIAHAGLAMAYSQKDSRTPDPQWKRLAAESARRALEANPDLAVAHLAKGIVLMREGRSEEALKELQVAHDADPRNSDTERWIGDYYTTVNDTAKAEDALRRAIDLAPNDWIPYQYFGRFLYRTARYEEAAKMWERADELAPDNVLVLRNLAAVYHQLNRTDEGIAKLQRSLEIQPNATSYANLGTMRFFQGRYTDAAAAFEKAVELNPTYFLYWGNLGDAYRWIPGSDQKARDAYERASALTVERLKTQGEDVELHGSLAIYLVKSGDRVGALERVVALEKMKRTPGSYFKSMMVYELAGQRDKALRDLESALRAGYALKEIDNEPELVTLRADPKYHRVLAALAK